MLSVKLHQHINENTVVLGGKKTKNEPTKQKDTP